MWEFYKLTKYWAVQNVNTGEEFIVTTREYAISLSARLNEYEIRSNRTYT